MLTAIEGLVGELRRMQVPISTSEVLDAMRAVTVTDISARAEFKSAIRACLVKSEDHRHAFDTVFELYFAPPVPDSAEDSGNGRLVAPLESLSDAELRDILIDAAAAEGDTLLREIANVTVDRHAGIQPGRAVAGTFYTYRAMRAMGADSLVAEILSRRHHDGPMAGLAMRMAREHAENRVERFRQLVESRIRIALVADRGADAVAATLRTPLPEDADFLTASSEQIAAMRTVMDPLGRKLASALTDKRKRSGRQVVDIRRTIRGSMSTGGIPLDLRMAEPRPSKPKLVVLADISGSVATFAEFTLRLMSALRMEFASLRSFVFIDGVDEVTHIFAEAGTIVEASTRINNEKLGVWLDGRSDYGHALEDFADRCLHDLDSRSTVLILGDARNNYHNPRADILDAVHARAGHLYWLNPEKQVLWNSGDSVISEYSKHCDEVHECRNIRQLAAFVEALD
ncbi:vWA domain-containing protein [Rhodococcus erythropolis]|uniref:vWA domain-containing protein n=1 Tax=Rhodococcus erythropolis TaxID=1833 RepID=UPI0036705420